MKKMILGLCALLLVPSLATAGGDGFSVSALRKQRSVCRQHHTEAKRLCTVQKCAKLRMQQRFPHDVQIQIVGKRPDFSGQKPEFRGGHHVRYTPCARAEGAAAVADIGDFQIGA